MKPANRPILRRKLMGLASAISFAPLVGRAEEAVVQIYAAATFRNVLDEILTAYRAHGHNAAAVYAPTPVLVQQMEAGAQADIFLSADPGWMDEAARRGLVRAQTRVDLMGNELVLVGPRSNRPPGQIDSAAAVLAAVGHGSNQQPTIGVQNLADDTKGGLTRSGPNGWSPVGSPAYLRQCVLMSLRRLGVERIDLWQLHRIDPKTPREEQFGVIADMQKEGLIRHVGLSEVGIDDIEAVLRHFPVATVQNEYNLVNRKSEAVLDFCEQHGIGFIPWFPLAAGKLAQAGSVLAEIADRLGATMSQIALAWILKRAAVMLPIPGTSRVEHLVENVAGAAVLLCDTDFAALDQQARASA
jgi:pyridoxine 4-dehydrogenase